MRLAIHSEIKTLSPAEIIMLVHPDDRRHVPGQVVGAPGLVFNRLNGIPCV